MNKCSVGGVGDLCKSPCATRSGVHPHRCLQGVVGVQVVVCVSSLASDSAIDCQAEHGGSDGAPLCLSQGDGEGIEGQDVGADGHEVRLRTIKSYHGDRTLPRRRTERQLAHQWRCCSSPTPGGGWRGRRHKPETWKVPVLTLKSYHTNTPCRGLLQNIKKDLGTTPGLYNIHPLVL